MTSSQKKKNPTKTRIITLHDKKVCFITNRKVGSTAIWSLALDISSDFEMKDNFYTDKCRKKYKDYKKIFVFRDPIERSISNFAYWYLTDRPKKTEEYEIKRLFRKFSTLEEREKVEEKKDLNTFISHLPKFFKEDQHTEPQIYILERGEKAFTEKDFDVILPLSKLSDFLKKEFGYTYKDTRKVGTKDLKKDLKISEESKDIIRKLYKEDYNSFLMKEDLWWHA